MLRQKSKSEVQKRKIELIHKFLQLSSDEQQQVIDKIKEFKNR